MKIMAKTALAVVLSLGITGVTAAPATAQRKKAEEAPGTPQLKLSEAFRKVAQPLQSAAAAGDQAALDAAGAAATPGATTDDEKYFLAAVQLPAVAKAQDMARLSGLLDQLIVNPKTPATALPQYSFLRGQIAFQNKKPAEALPFLMRARELGYANTDLPLLIAQSQVDTGNVPAGVAELERAIEAETAAGRKAPEGWYSYAVTRLYTSGDRAGATTWLKKALAAYPTAENWRKTIILYRDGAGKGSAALANSQKLDLFRLMRASGALADKNDYLEYADLAFLAGVPNEAMRVIDEGKTTGKVPATDGTATRIRADAATAAKAETPLATLEKQAQAAATGRSAMGTADVFLAQGDFAKAATLYRLAMQKGGVDMSVANLRLGIALAQAGQKAEAKAALGAVQGGANADIAGLWSQWIDTPIVAA